MKVDKRELRDLLAHFHTHGVSHDPKGDLDKTIRFQDIVACSTHQELFDAYQELGQQERRTFLFAVCAACSPSLAEEVIKQTTIRVLRRALMDDFEEETKGEWSKIEGEQEKLREARKGIYKRLASLKRKISFLELKNDYREKVAEDTIQDRDRWREKYYQTCESVTRDREEADKFRQLRDLLLNDEG